MAFIKLREICATALRVPRVQLGKCRGALRKQSDKAAGMSPHFRSLTPSRYNHALVLSMSKYFRHYNAYQCERQEGPATICRDVRVDAVSLISRGHLFAMIPTTTR